MRVTIIARKLDYGGGGTSFSLDLIGRTLEEKGINVNIITLRPDLNDISFNPEYNLIEPEGKFRTTIPGEKIKCYSILKEYSDITDIYHNFETRYMAPAGYYASKNDSQPIVSRLNAYGFCTNTSVMRGECYKNCTAKAKFTHDNRSLAKKLAKFPLYISQTHIEPKYTKLNDRYFAISPQVRDIYVNLGIPQRKVKIVPNFYDPDFPSDDTNTDILDDEFHALYVGRLTPSKGVDTLLKAASQIQKLNVSIVGDGPSLGDLRSLADDLNITQRINFHNWVNHDDLPKYYNKADVFIHPALLPEPFGRTILESLQCGTPAIVSDQGGPPWVVGKAGKVFESGNNMELTSILESLIQDKNKIRELKEHCPSRLEYFNPNKIISSLISEYESMVN